MSNQHNMTAEASADTTASTIEVNHRLVMSQPSHYPAPFIVEPAGNHRQSWIILHGRGDTGKMFSIGDHGFLRLPLPSGLTLQQHLPHVRFIFPTASPRYAQAFGFASYTQWFDIYSWDSDDKSEWQAEGLRETSAWVHELMRREIEVVGAENVVLGGLSQGCASALISWLLWEGPPIRGLFGMSGWLPFRHVLELYAERKYQGDAEAFKGDRAKLEEADGCSPAIRALREELGVPLGHEGAAPKVPIWLAHGVADETVDIRLGRQAAGCLRKLGFDVTWDEYEQLDHWMRGDELDGVVRWVDAQ